MNTRVDRDEYGVRDGASGKHEQTLGIVHEQPPMSLPASRRPLTTLPEQ
ncbi:hypothetical protein [Nocardia testacea]|uniref:Uncharacterized protein n=1 Tax=Nocardia testacea TaxID=248551 RepID=A0ABW7VQR8_9NOCA